MRNKLGLLLTLLTMCFSVSALAADTMQAGTWDMRMSGTVENPQTKLNMPVHATHVVCITPHKNVDKYFNPEGQDGHCTGKHFSKNGKMYIDYTCKIKGGTLLEKGWMQTNGRRMQSVTATTSNITENGHPYQMITSIRVIGKRVSNSCSTINSQVIIGNNNTINTVQ